jgi:hypothetical protein
VRPTALSPGGLVVVSLHSPREKYWGKLLAILPAGVIVRGLALDVFDDWVRQERGVGERMIAPVAVFFPMGRVERIEGDESAGPVRSFGERFAGAVGLSASTALSVRRGRAAGSPARAPAYSASGRTGAKKAGTKR